MTRHYNRKTETAKRKQLRNNATDTEQKLWQYLKGKQIAGVKFRRQYSIDSYVIDFYAPSIKLAVEIDGPTHFTKDGIEYDKRRTKFIERFGITILRFTNEDVYRNIEGVLRKIEHTINELKPPPTPSLVRRGPGGG